MKSGAVPAARLFFRGSGAIVWKNLLLLLRSWKAVVPNLMVGLVFVLPIALATRTTGLYPTAGTLVPLVMVTLFWSSALGFDLRRETDRLDQLRALPLSSAAIVFAELLLPWSVGVTLQETLVAVLSWTGACDRNALSMLAIALPVLAFLAVTIDNLALFMFAPRSQAGAARGSMATSSPAQMLRLLAWVVTATPGLGVGSWVFHATHDVVWSALAGGAIEIAFAAGLFFLLVRWFDSKEMESAVE